MLSFSTKKVDAQIFTPVKRPAQARGKGENNSSPNNPHRRLRFLFSLLPAQAHVHVHYRAHFLVSAHTLVAPCCDYVMLRLLIFSCGADAYADVRFLFFSCFPKSTPHILAPPNAGYVGRRCAVLQPAFVYLYDFVPRSGCMHSVVRHPCRQPISVRNASWPRTAAL